MENLPSTEARGHVRGAFSWLLLANFLGSLCRPCLLDLGSEDPEERGGPQSTAAANRASGPLCFTQMGNKESTHPRKVV